MAAHFSAILRKVEHEELLKASSAAIEMEDDLESVDGASDVAWDDEDEFEDMLMAQVAICAHMAKERVFSQLALDIEKEYEDSAGPTIEAAGIDQMQAASQADVLQAAAKADSSVPKVQNDVVPLYASLAVGSPVRALRAKRLERALSAPHVSPVPPAGHAGPTVAAPAASKTWRAASPAKDRSTLKRGMEAALRAGLEVVSAAAAAAGTGGTAFDLHAGLWTGRQIHAPSKPSARGASLGALKRVQMPGALPSLVDRSRFCRMPRLSAAGAW